ncbi:MAG: CapA family protein, partial [bacterium]|nr:CapA family protein [bacterium]
INIVSLANNHCWDSGKKGIEECKKLLDNNHINYILPNKELIIDKANTKAAIITEYYLDDHLYNNLSARISRLKRSADIIVIYLHWGEEYKLKPESWQIELAHKLIDAGADLIVGAHPHVLQSTEIYKNKYIFYSLGNFIFDQTQSNTLDSVIVKLSISNKLLNITTLPIKRNLFFPEYKN